MEEIVEVEYVDYPHWGRLKYDGVHVKPSIKETTATIECCDKCGKPFKYIEKAKEMGCVECRIKFAKEVSKAIENLSVNPFSF